MSLKTVFNELSIQTEEPVWLRELREEAYSLLQKAPFPGPEMEAWRKIPLRNFDPEKYESVSALFSITQNSLQQIEDNSGVRISSFTSLLGEDEAFVRARFEELLDKYKEDYFALYSLCYFTDGILVSVKDHTNLEKSVTLDYAMNATANFFSPLSFVRVGKFSQIDLIEKNTSVGNGEQSLLVSLTDISINESAKLTYSAIESFDKGLLHFKTIATRQEKNSTFQGFHFHTGGNRGKTFYISDVNGEGASLNLNGIAEMSGREFNDVEMRVNHFKGNSESAIRFKTVLSGKAHNVFTGNLYIPAKLKHVTASQINNNLLMEQTARAESIPGLEVFAEDIHCTHGATVGELDEELIFYLNSRGLDDKEAKSIIVGAFISSLLEMHSSGDAVEIVKQMLLDKGYSI